MTARSDGYDENTVDVPARVIAALALLEARIVVRANVGPVVE